MRYAILSDVHSNREALEAVLGAIAAERTDRLLCGGDLVGYAADPEPCIEMTRAASTAVVAGNHDWAAVGKMSTAWFHDAARAAVEWTAARLSAPSRDYLAGLPLTWRDEQVTLVHGTLHEPEAFHYLLEPDDAARTAALQSTPLTFVGHTHVPIVFEMDDAGTIRTIWDHAVRLRPGFRYVVNVGSVGQPRDQDPRACYGLYDAGERLLEFRRVPYPVARTQAKVREAGLPSWFAERLARGT